MLAFGLRNSLPEREILYQSGAFFMKLSRIFQVIGLSLTTLAAPSLFLGPSRAPAPSRAYAQETEKKQAPPLRRSKRPPNEEEQDRPKGQTAISVAVDLVSLQVLVTDLKGNVVTGLSPENFTVYEDNVKQEINH